MQATHGRYLRMSLTILKIVGGAVLLCVPTALALYYMGKPAIHLLFQHGAFNAHSSALTSMALFGYAILAIPLAASIVGTVEAACLSLILFVRLRKKGRTDKGLLRLKMRRLQSARATIILADVGEVS